MFKDQNSIDAPLLAAILVVAAALRLWGLNQGLWYDEIVTLTEFIRKPASELLVVYGSLNNHLAYTWIAKATTGLFGEAPWAVRLPAAIMGVVSIWAVWLLIRHAGLRWVALVTAALLAVSYHHVWFSQNARGYTGLLLFTSLSALFMAKGLRDRKLSDWAFYAVCAAAALLTHLSAAFLLTAQGLAALAFGYRDVFVKKTISLWPWFKGPLIGFGGAIVIALIVFAPMLPNLIETFGAYNAPEEHKTGAGVEEWRSPIWTAIEILRSFGAIAFAVPLAALFAILGGYRMFRSAPFITAPFLIHIPLTIGILLLAEFRIWPRYFFVDIGFLMATIVYGAFLFADFAVKKAPVLSRLSFAAPRLKLIGSLFMIAVSLPLLLPNYHAPKQDFVSAKAFLEAQNVEAQSIVTVGLAQLPYGDYLAPDWNHFETVAELERALKTSGPIWIVATFPEHFRTTYPELAARVEQEFTLAQRFNGTLSGGAVYVYQRNPS